MVYSLNPPNPLLCRIIELGGIWGCVVKGNLYCSLMPRHTIYQHKVNIVGSFSHRSRRWLGWSLQETCFQRGTKWLLVKLLRGRRSQVARVCSRERVWALFSSLARLFWIVWHLAILFYHCVDKRWRWHGAGGGDIDGQTEILTGQVETQTPSVLTEGSNWLVIHAAGFPTDSKKDWDI